MPRPGGGSYREAVRAFADLLGGAQTELGHLLERRDKPEEALQRFHAAVQLTPADALAWYNFGDTLLSLGRNEEAVGALAMAVELAPGVDLAKTKSRKLIKPARSHFAKVLQIRPDHAWALYDIACLDAREGNRAAAFRNLGRALEHGLEARDHILKDPDLKPLRSDSRWRTLEPRLR